MSINYLLIIFLVLVVVCVVTGLKKGMLSIIYGCVALIFVFWFASFSAPLIQDYLCMHTEISVDIYDSISEKLEDRYKVSEEEEAGSGVEAIRKLVPEKIVDNVKQDIDNSIEIAIDGISDELTQMALKGVSYIIGFIVAIILAWLGSLLVDLIGKAPVISSVNKGMGFIAGLLQAIFIMWVVMFIADCFPTSLIGQFVITYSQEDTLLQLIYSNNLISIILG